MIFFPDEFENVIKKTTFFNKIEFNFDTEFVRMYFGADKKDHVRFDDFSHLLQVSKCTHDGGNMVQQICSFDERLFLEVANNKHLLGEMTGLCNITIDFSPVMEVQEINSPFRK